jgi:hypothetical protein
MNDELKEKIKSNAMHYWYILAIIIMFGIGLLQHQSKVSTQQELEALKAKVNITEDIKKLDEKLAAMKAREEQYLKVFEKQDELNKSLAELEKKQKELNKKKKEVMKNEISKMDNSTLFGEFTKLGFPNTTISSGQ